MMQGLCSLTRSSTTGGCDGLGFGRSSASCKEYRSGRRRMGQVEVGDEDEDEDAVGVFWRDVAMGHVAKGGFGGGVG